MGNGISGSNQFISNDSGMQKLYDEATTLSNGFNVGAYFSEEEVMNAFGIKNANKKPKEFKTFYNYLTNGVKEGLTPEYNELAPKKNKKLVSAHDIKIIFENKEFLKSDFAQQTTALKKVSMYFRDKEVSSVFSTKSEMFALLNQKKETEAANIFTKNSDEIMRTVTENFNEDFSIAQNIISNLTDQDLKKQYRNLKIRFTSLNNTPSEIVLDSFLPAGTKAYKNNFDFNAETPEDMRTAMIESIKPSFENAITSNDIRVLIDLGIHK